MGAASGMGVEEISVANGEALGVEGASLGWEEVVQALNARVRVSRRVIFEGVDILLLGLLFGKRAHYTGMNAGRPSVRIWNIQSI